MQPDAFRTTLEAESSTWVEANLITPEQRDSIRALYANAGAGSSSTNALVALMYATAGALVGAAAIAVVAVGFEVTDQGLPFFLAALVLVGAGVGVGFLPERRLAADALLVAALVPLTVSVFPEDRFWGSLIALVAPLGLLAYRLDQPFVTSLSVAAFSVAAVGTYVDFINVGFELPWFASQAALVAALIAVGRYRGASTGAGGAVAVIALAISAVPFLDDGIGLNDSVTVELALGGLLAGILSVAAFVKDRGVLVGAAIALAVDGVVFAFDVGGILLALGVLLGLAALLVTQAESVRRLTRA